jgi:hypothetical protein
VRQDRGYLLTRQVAQHRPVEALGRDGQHPPGDRQRGRVPDRGVAHERVDRCQAGVTGPGTVAAHGLQVVEEVQHERRVEVGQLQRGRRFAGAVPSEAEEQFERVAVGLDGAGAGAALCDQALQEEVLHQLAEPDLRGSHDPPAGMFAAKPWNLSAMMPSSSGTADMYQYTSRTSTWPR